MNVILNITARGAKNLKSTERFTQQDPYLNLWVSSNKRKVSTRVHDDGGSQAVWGDSFELVIHDATSEFLYLEVMNKCRLTSDRLIGRAKVSIQSLQKTAENTKVEEWFKILSESGKIAGDVQLEVCWRNKTTPAAGGGSSRTVTMQQGASNDSLSAASGVGNSDGFSTVAGDKRTPATTITAPHHSPPSTSAQPPSEINTYVREVANPTGGRSDSVAASDGFCDGFSTAPTASRAAAPQQQQSHNIIGGFSTASPAMPGVTTTQGSSTQRPAPTVGGFTSGANNSTLHYSSSSHAPPAAAAPVPTAAVVVGGSTATLAQAQVVPTPPNQPYNFPSTQQPQPYNMPTTQQPQPYNFPSAHQPQAYNMPTTQYASSTYSYASTASSAQHQPAPSGGLASIYMQNQSQTQPQQSHQPYQSLYGAHAPPAAPGQGALPRGWEQKTAPNGRTYYVCHETKTTQWERPT